MRVLFVDFPSESQSLLHELRGYGCETANLPRDDGVQRLGRTGFGHLLSNLSAKCDVIYYTKFVSRGFEDFPPYVSGIKCRSILGFHTPVLIAHPDRSIYKLYNLIGSARLAMHKSLRVFDAFHSLNTQDQAILSMMGFRTFLIPNGFDEVLFRPREKGHEEFTVIFTGSLYHKGADIAARIAYALTRRHGDIRFLFVDGAKRTYMDNAVDYRQFFSESSTASVAAMDYINRHEFAASLGRSHLLLFPSKWEASPKIVLEALGCGCPVVCFDIPGPPCRLISSQGTGYVAKPFDVNELARGILTFYNLWKNRFDDYVELSHRCHKVSLMFSWKRLARRYLEMFELVRGLGDRRS